MLLLAPSCDDLELPSWLEDRLKKERAQQQLVLLREDLQRKYRPVQFTGTSPILALLLVSMSSVRQQFSWQSNRGRPPVTESTVDLLHSFTNCSGLDLIFGLNALLRTAANTWNSSNARSLLQYCESRQYRMSWELGNGTRTR